MESREGREKDAERGVSDRAHLSILVRAPHLIPLLGEVFEADGVHHIECKRSLNI